MWYIGACVTGYFMIYLNVSLGVSAVLLWWFWIVSVDGPHVFGTISRTYLDSEEWEQRSRLMLGSLGWFLLGPAMLAVGLTLVSELPFLIFLTFAQLWAYWHVVRQHYGFMVIYQKKNGEAAGKENRLDYWIFYILMVAPFVSFIIRHPDARSQLGLGADVTALESSVVTLIYGLIAAAIALYVGKELLSAFSGKSLNIPKNLFLLACLPLHLFIFLHPTVSTKIDIRLFAVFVTFYHNIQYHGIIWFYNRNRYGSNEDRTRFGLAGRISRNFLTYYVAGILFTLAYRYSNWFFAGTAVPLATGPNPISEFALGNLFSVSDLAIGFWWGFAFNHYYLDQKIWKLSKDRRLNRDLKLEA